jgi:hypothetical protein
MTPNASSETDRVDGVPARLRELTVVSVDQPPQPAILLDRERWSPVLEVREHVLGLPTKLDRGSVREFPRRLRSALRGLRAA